MSPRPVLAHTPENVAEFRGVRESLYLWWRDFDRAIEYVEPVDEHGPVYSHRFFELLLRAATEFESFAKAYADLRGGQLLPDKPNMSHYRKLLLPLRLDEGEVGVRQWRPDPLFVRPFESWAHGGEDSPEWYRQYNDVKHSRRAEFPKASMLNAVTGAAGVFAALILAYDNVRGLWPRSGRTKLDPPAPSGEVEHFFFQDCPFILRAPRGVLG